MPKEKSLIQITIEAPPGTAFSLQRLKNNTNPIHPPTPQNEPPNQLLLYLRGMPIHLSNFIHNTTDSLLTQLSATTPDPTYTTRDLKNNLWKTLPKIIVITSPEQLAREIQANTQYLKRSQTLLETADEKAKETINCCKQINNTSDSEHFYIQIETIRETLKQSKSAFKSALETLTVFKSNIPPAPENLINLFSELDDLLHILESYNVHYNKIDRNIKQITPDSLTILHETVIPAIESVLDKIEEIQIRIQELHTTIQQYPSESATQ